MKKKILLGIIVLLGIYYVSTAIMDLIINLAYCYDPPGITLKYHKYNKIDECKKKGSFCFEYDSVSVKYKSITFNVNAYVQHPYAAYRNVDTLILCRDKSSLMLLFTDERDMREINYGKDWVINDEWNNIPTNAYYIYKSYRNFEMPEDTLTFYIREKRIVNNLDHSQYENSMSAAWDTVQSFQLVRKMHE